MGDASPGSQRSGLDAVDRGRGDSIVDEDMDAGVSLGVLIRARRKAAGLKLRELAERCGISGGSLSNIESELCLPGQALLRELASALYLGANDRDEWEAIRLDELSRHCHARTRRRTRAKAIVSWGCDASRSVITSWRLALRMPSAELARRTGVNPSTLSGLECGSVSPRGIGDWTPSAVAIAEFLGMSCEMVWPQHVPKVAGDAAESPETPEDVCAMAEEVAILRNAMRSLTANERRVVAMRFGLDDDTPMDGVRIGEVLGVSKQRVFQLECSAVKKLAGFVI